MFAQTERLFNNFYPLIRSPGPGGSSCCQGSMTGVLPVICFLSENIHDTCICRQTIEMQKSVQQIWCTWCIDSWYIDLKRFLSESQCLVKINKTIQET